MCERIALQHFIIHHSLWETYPICCFNMDTPTGRDKDKERSDDCADANVDMIHRHPRIGQEDKNVGCKKAKANEHEEEVRDLHRKCCHQRAI